MVVRNKMGRERRVREREWEGAETGSQYILQGHTSSDLMSSKWALPPKASTVTEEQHLGYYMLDTVAFGRHLRAKANSLHGPLPLPYALLVLLILLSAMQS